MELAHAMQQQVSDVGLLQICFTAGRKYLVFCLLIPYCMCVCIYIWIVWVLDSYLWWKLGTYMYISTVRVKTGYISELMQKKQEGRE